MADVIDKASGQQVQIPDDQVVDQWKAGKVDLVSGKRYQVQLQNGMYGTVPAEKMADAIDVGARIVSPAEAQAARMQKVYGGAEGGAEGFSSELLSQATGGLADEALLGAARAMESAGLRPKGYAQAFTQELAAPREEHPIATTAGAGLGAIALGAALPGGGLAGAAERGAATATEGLGESTLAQIARRGIVSAARDAAAGTQMGVAQAVSDDAFADHHETAEHIVGTVGSSTLWGGALGAGFGLLGGVGSALRGTASAETRAALEDAIAQRSPSDDAIAKVGASAIGVEPAPGLGSKLKDWYVRAASAASGKDADLLEKFVSDPLDEGSQSYANRRAIQEAQETRDEASRSIRSNLDDLLTASRDVTDEARGPLKRGYLRAALSDAAADTTARIDPDAGLGTTAAAAGERQPIDIGRAMERDSMGRFKKGTGVRISPSLGEFAEPSVEPLSIGSARADAMAAKARGLADHALSTLYDMRDAPGQFGGVAPIKNAIQVLEEQSQKLDSAIESRDVAEQFAIVDDMKKAIGKYTKGASRLSPAMATDELVASQNRARAAQLQSLYATLRSGLEDESVWGRAASDQQAINAAWTQQIEASQRFHKALTTEVGRDPDNPWMTIRGVDPAKADTYVRGLLDPAKDLTHKAVRDYVDSTSRLADVIGQAYDLPPEKAAQVAAIKKAANAFQQTIGSTENSLSLVNQFDAIRAKTDGPSTALGAIAGFASHGVAGGLAGLALGKVASVFTHPADMILQLANIEKMARESDGRIGRALRAFGKGAARQARVPDGAAYARKAARVRALLSSPDTLAERVGTNLGSLRTRAPRLADAITGTTLAGIQFLGSKLPDEPPADPFEPKRRMPDPPTSVRDTWMRYYTAVEDPVGVVEDLRDGRISPEGVEVLREVYPKLYQNVRQQAYDLMANGKLSDLTKQQRIGLALTLDIEVPELAPAYIAARQQLWQPSGAAAQESGSQEKPKPARTKAIDLTKHTPQLAADRLESGVTH